MAVFTLSQRVSRSQAEVFAVLRDLTALQAWAADVRRLHSLETTLLERGVRYRETRLLRGGDVDMTFVVDRCDPPRLLSLSGVYQGVEQTYHYTVEPDGADAALVQLDCEIRGRGLARMIAPAISGELRATCAARLGRLRELLEATNGPPQAE